MVSQVHILGIFVLLTNFYNALGQNATQWHSKARSILLYLEVKRPALNDLNSEFHTNLNVDSAPCITPNYEESSCVGIRQCGVLLKLYNASTSSDFLNKSWCGHHNENKKNPKVCCGKYSDYQNKTLKSAQHNRRMCGTQKVRKESRIYGGNKAVRGEFPWMARLFYKKNGIKTFECAGFLIMPKFVLTAAHCLSSDRRKTFGTLFEVHLGVHDTRTLENCDLNNTVYCRQAQKIRVKKFFLYPGYSDDSPNHINDIGIVKLKKAAKITDYVNLICIELPNDFSIKQYWISGWGETKGGNTSSVKMKVSLPPFQFENCSSLFEDGQNIVLNKSLHTCAGGLKNRDSCVGDSGGPLMVLANGGWHATGVVSFGIGCGMEGWPGVYTNMNSYLKWILGHLVD